MSPQTRRVVLWDLIPLLVAIVLAGPLTYVVLDRAPPQWRVSGTISAYGDPHRAPRAGERFEVTWTSTPHLRDCPGIVQAEILTLSDQAVWTKMSRGAYEPHREATEFTPPPWAVPLAATPGPAVYRVTTFWYCTWVERLFNWPVIQVGPDVEFTILPGLVRSGP